MFTSIPNSILTFVYCFISVITAVFNFGVRYAVQVISKMCTKQEEIFRPFLKHEAWIPNMHAPSLHHQGWTPVTWTMWCYFRRPDLMCAFKMRRKETEETEGKRTSGWRSTLLHNMSVRDLHNSADCCWESSGSFPLIAELQPRQWNLEHTETDSSHVFNLVRSPWKHSKQQTGIGWSGLSGI